MGKKSANKQQMSAVPMHRFGINSVVLTPHKDLEALCHKLTSTPDFHWGEGGMGKAYLHQQLHSQLKTEDSYFEANLHEADPSNQRWVNFMDDCVIFAVLDAVINDEPLQLMHPTSWDKFIKRSKIPLSTKQRPSVLPGVPVY